MSPDRTERQAPFFVGIDVGKQTHYASVVDLEATPCWPKALAFANTSEGSAPWYAALKEATAQAAPAAVTVGCEATGPDGLSLYEALTAQGYRVRGLHPL